MRMQFARTDEELKTESFLFRLTPGQKRALTILATEDGIAVAEVLRRALDFYVKNRAHHSQSSDPTDNRT